MVVGESMELILVLITVVITMLLMLGVERVTRHEGPESGAKE
jgi:hypothetical protein